MGSFLSGVLGTNSQYQATPAQAGNAYSPAVLQDELNKQAQIYAQQQQLGQQLYNQTQGLGPNPAETQFQQNAQQNIENAQGLIAAQRGLNPALAAKIGANTASNANQQAAAQASLLRQQQQLGAQQNLGNLLGQQQQGNLGAQQLYGGQNTAAMQTNANVATGNQQQSGNIIGGILGGAGSALGLSEGGMVDSTQSVPSSAAGLFLKEAVHKYDGGQIHNFKPGGPVPGNAKVQGDSLKNDTVPAVLSPKEIVLPRSITMDKDAPEKAAKFVAAILARQNMRKNS